MAYGGGADEAFSRASKPPKTQEDWHDKRRWVDIVLREIGGVVIRVGDETVGEMWSLYDGRDVLNEIDPQFGENIARHIARAHD
jgi:4-hydroxyphenylacetate 3-monooxygenase